MFRTATLLLLGLMVSAVPDSRAGAETRLSLSSDFAPHPASG